MAFSAVFQFIPGDSAGMNRFLLDHYLEHQEFYRSLLGQNPSVVTANYPIHRMENPTVWLAAHQEMSQSVWSGIGGGQSVDFGRVDWEDPEKVQEWLQTHDDWHRQVRDALGL